MNAYGYRMICFRSRSALWNRPGKACVVYLERDGSALPNRSTISILMDESVVHSQVPGELCLERACRKLVSKFVSISLAMRTSRQLSAYQQGNRDARLGCRGIRKNTDVVRGSIRVDIVRHPDLPC